MFVYTFLDKLEQSQQNFDWLVCIRWLKIRNSRIALILKNYGLRITGTGSSCGACTLMIYTMDCRSTGTGCGSTATGVSACLGSHYVDQENVYSKFFLVISILTISRSHFICQTIHALFLHSFMPLIIGIQKLYPTSRLERCHAINDFTLIKFKKSKK